MIYTYLYIFKLYDKYMLTYAGSPRRRSTMTPTARLPTTGCPAATSSPRGPAGIRRGASSSCSRKSSLSSENGARRRPQTVTIACGLTCRTRRSASAPAQRAVIPATPQRFRMQPPTSATVMNGLLFRATVFLRYMVLFPHVWEHEGNVVKRSKA